MILCKNHNMTEVTFEQTNMKKHTLDQKNT